MAEPLPPPSSGGEGSVDLDQPSFVNPGGSFEDSPLPAGQCSPPSSLRLGQDSSEPLTASPDPNPLGRIAADSVEKLGPPLNPRKGKNKNLSPPSRGRKR